MSSWVQEGLQELGYGPAPVTKSETSDIPQVSTYEGEEWQPRWSDVKERVTYKPEYMGELLEYAMKLPCGKTLVYSRIVVDWSTTSTLPSLKSFYTEGAKREFAKEGGWKLSDWVD